MNKRRKQPAAWSQEQLATLLALMLFDDTGSPLSPQELVLMHRHGEEPFSWEDSSPE
jgi:hypothetical protein